MNLRALAHSLILAPAVLVLTTACHRGGGSSSSPQPELPSITALEPAQGPVGTSVVIRGTNLGAITGVAFPPDLAASFNVDSDTQATAVVPPGAVTGPLVLRSAPGTTLGPAFLVTDPPAVRPTLDDFAPDTARAYGDVTLVGVNFTGASQVTFGGAAALRFTVVSDGEILAAVPAGAATGRIVVTTLAGTGTSARNFTFDPGTPDPPTITALAPQAGPPGTTVRVQGRGLNAVAKVEFSGTSVPFQIASGTGLTFTVPPGAASGPVTVTSSAGATAVSTGFTVTAGAAPAPTFLTFTPQRGPRGQVVTISGSGMTSVASATVGGKPVRGYAPDDGTFRLWIPEQGATSGPIVLACPSGTVTHPTPFQVTYAAPVITSVEPLQGPAGTPVWIEGDNLFEATAVRFGTTPATSIVIRRNDYLQVLVPAGATSGPVTVASPAGEVRSAATFTVLAGPTTVDTRIAGLYVTQATQRMDRSVPLIAGRAGKVRVFLEANFPNTFAPSVRVTVADAAGATLVTRDIPAPGGGVPTRVDDTAPGRSWDFTLDGTYIRPGITIRAQILGAAGVPDLSAEDSSYPSDGSPLALNVVAVPPVGLTIIPVNQGGRVGRVSDASRSLESWLTVARQIWPFKDIDLVQGPVLNWTGNVSPYDAMAWLRLRNAMEAARLAADPRSRRYHFGVISQPDAYGILGMGDWADSPGSNLARSAVGWDGTGTPDAENYYTTYAHELGHNLMRRHSPCGGAAGPDPGYPYPLARLGATGFDVPGNRIFHPDSWNDIMSYCNPQWVSDYTFRKVMEDRAWESTAAQAAVAPAQPGLLVWGTIYNGQVELQPAMQVADISTQPTPGDYTLVLRDAAGAILAEVSFDAPEAEDLPPGVDARSFAFALPLPPDLQASLATLEVVSGAQALNLGGPAPRAALAFAAASGVALPRDPEATAWGPGVVHLSWDAATHPMVLVKDAASGDVIGLVQGGSADLITGAAELDLNLSAGPRSVTVRVKVRP